MTDIPKEIVEKFMNMCCALSPECLYEDGEISETAAQRKYRTIMKGWRTLEREVGRGVSEDEIWQLH